MSCMTSPRSCRGATLCLSLTIVFLALVAGSSASRAQCIPFSDRAASAELQSFLSEPTAILRTLRNDNEKITSKVAQLIETNPALLTSVRKLVADAPTVTRPAIGAGLRRAAMQCAGTQPEDTRRIIDFVRNLADTSVLGGYVAVTEENPARYNAGSLPTQSSANKQLFTGEWKTELVDPFAAIPLPQ